MNIIELLIGFFGVIALITGILFILKKEGSICFGLFLLLFSYNIFFYVAVWSRFNLYLLGNMLYSYFIPFSLYGPLFYFYLKKTIGEAGFRKRDILHFAPFLMTIICYGGFYFLRPSAKISIYNQGLINEYIYVIPYFGVYLTIIMVGYVVFIFIKYSSIALDDRELQKWLKIIIYSFALFVFSIVLYYILFFSNILKIEHDYGITISMIIFVIIVSYLTYKYPEIFNGKSVKEILPFIKYEKTGLSDEFSRELSARLINLMNSEKPYLESDLRLGKLAAMLNVPRHHVSQVINEHFNLSYFDFINQYRIRESEKLLINKSKELTIKDVLYESGFNNKVSFYKAFKKFHNMTPTEFIEKNQ